MAAGLVAHFQMLGRYNRLANERLYAACAELDDAARRKDRGAFFRSIHGTLNHIMVGDRIWMARFEGGTASSTGLDAILHDDFDELRAARTVEDARIEAFTAGTGRCPARRHARLHQPRSARVRRSDGGAAAALLQPPDPPSRPDHHNAEADRLPLSGAGHAPRDDSRAGRRHRVGGARQPGIVHQTPHRVRIAAMPRQTGCPCPELDSHRVPIPGPSGDME